MSTQDPADLLAERDRLRADVAELVKAAQAGLNEWDYRCTTGGGIHAVDAPAIGRSLAPLRALLAKHREPA